MARKRMTPKSTEHRLEVRAEAETMRGRYANHIQIGFTEHEFIMDLFAVSGESVQHLQKFFLSPAHARKLSELLQQQVARYDDVHGTPIKAKTGASKKKRKSVRPKK